MNNNGIIKNYKRTTESDLPINYLVLESYQSCSKGKTSLKNFTKFTILFLIKVFMPATLLKGESNTGVFLLVYHNF